MTSSTPSELIPELEPDPALLQGIASADPLAASSEPNHPEMTEEQLLDGVMQASNLQQAGQDAAAIALYQTLAAADPQGQYGAMARKALEAMSQTVALSDAVVTEQSPDTTQVAGEDATATAGPERSASSLNHADAGLVQATAGQGETEWSADFSSDFSGDAFETDPTEPIASPEQANWDFAGSAAAVAQPPLDGETDAGDTFRTHRLQLLLANWSVGRKQWFGVGLSALLSVMGCVGLGTLATGQLARVASPEQRSERTTDAAAVTTVTLQDAKMQLMVQVAIASLLLAIAHALLGYLLSRTVAAPLAQLKQAAQTLAPGQLLHIVSTDELGDLALTLNEQSTQLGELYVQLNDARDRLEAMALQNVRETEAQRQETEQLQKRVMELLLEIDGARQGNLTVRARVTDDEMGSVADAFNSTVASLQNLVLQIQDVASRVDQSVAASDQSVSLLADAANQQAESMNEALQSVEQMSTSIEDVAATASEAASISRRASEAADAGGEAMNQTVLSINALRGNVAETSKKVKRLTESSQEISKIVGLISEISAKTNLLAFNASIEAVRAGEHGQGFRIVADEVRRLAEQVTDATQDIEQLVTGIQLETAEVLTMMERGTEQVVTGSQLVDTTRSTLASLVETNQEIDGLLQTISTSTASQTAVSSAVGTTMQSVATLAQSSSSESATVAETLRQLVVVSQQLQHSVAQFQARQS